jgi:electron transport complex protein RnfG
MSMEAPETREVPSWRLLATLGVAGAVAGLLVMLVQGWAEPRIESHRAAVLQAAIMNVLGEPARYDTLYVSDAGLTQGPAAGTDTRTADRVYLGYDAAGRPVGYAITAAEPGFQDVIRLIFGYEPASGNVLGMQVLENKETPGLGDKIEKDASFVAEFEGARAPLAGVKAGAGAGGPGEVDMITGATISSRAVIGIINRRLERLDPLLRTYVAEETP